MEPCKRSIFLVTMLAIALFPALASASPRIGPSSSLRMNSIREAKPEGKYVVYLLQGGAWQEVGALSYDKFFQEKRIDLGRGATGEKRIKVRLEQRGGGAAHIDSVFLGGLPPSEVKGMKGEKVLKKLSQKDFDVIDAFGQDLELQFSPAKDRVLSLTARVEGERISETPFQFPRENLYKSMNEKSVFYTYQMVDSRFEEAPPFFKEYSLTGTGHPSGYTYGWVWNDDQHLYVKIDFTPDNTMDGDKDYAKVYVNVEGQVKEFKVSESETRWGQSDFTYTDKVSYEHKVYGFKIPLRQIGIKGEGKEQELLLAFSAYGTAGPPGIGFSPTEYSYLVAYGKSGGIYGQIVNPDGLPQGADFAITDSSSFSYGDSIAYDSANQRYLMVWMDHRNSATTGYDIYGQFVNANGTLSGSNFVICNANADQRSARVAYDSANQRFLVVWTDERDSATTSTDIYGQLVNANGTLMESDFIICNANSEQNEPLVAYDSVNQRFLVVWTDDRTSAITGNDVYGQFVNANGFLDGGDFVINGDAGHQYGPSLAYNSICSNFLVAYWAESALAYLVVGTPCNIREGTIGTRITVLGSGYGAKKGKVLVGTVALKILEWTDSSVRCQLMRPLFPGTYDVTIRPRGASPIMIEGRFIVKAPEIESVEPNTGSAGDAIKIKGEFFGTRKPKVSLGGKNCKVLNWEMDPTTGQSAIQFIVPKGLVPGTYELKVTTTGVGSDTVNFTVE